ncbi:hypothetical protein ACOMHN_008613 [Nucella lapillus]
MVVDGQICRSSVLALAIKYADQLQTHLPHVLDSLEELWELAHTAVRYSVSSMAFFHFLLAGEGGDLSSDPGQIVVEEQTRPGGGGGPQQVCHCRRGNTFLGST